MVPSDFLQEKKTNKKNLPNCRERGWSHRGQRLWMCVPSLVMQKLFLEARCRVREEGGTEIGRAGGRGLGTLLGHSHCCIS